MISARAKVCLLLGCGLLVGNAEAWAKGNTASDRVVKHPACREKISRLMEQVTKETGFEYGKFGESALTQETWGGDQRGGPGFERSLVVTPYDVADYDGILDDHFLGLSSSKKTRDVKKVLASCVSERSKQVRECASSWKKAGEPDNSARIKACHKIKIPIASVRVDKLIDEDLYSLDEQGWPTYSVSFSGCHFTQATGLMAKSFHVQPTNDGCNISLVNETPKAKGQVHSIEASYGHCPYVETTPESRKRAIGWPAQKCDEEQLKKSAAWLCYQDNKDIYGRSNGKKTGWDVCEKMAENKKSSFERKYVKKARKQCEQNTKTYASIISKSKKLCSKYKDEFDAVAAYRKKYPSTPAVAGQQDTSQRNVY